MILGRTNYYLDFPDKATRRRYADKLRAFADDVDNDRMSEEDWIRKIQTLEWKWQDN